MKKKKRTRFNLKNKLYLYKQVKSLELTPRQVLWDKKRASAGPKGQFLSALKDDFFRIIKTNLSLGSLFEVHITLGFQSEVSAFI